MSEAIDSESSGDSPRREYFSDLLLKEIDRSDSVQSTCWLAGCVFGSGMCPTKEQLAVTRAALLELHREGVLERSKGRNGEYFWERKQPANVVTMSWPGEGRRDDA